MQALKENPASAALVFSKLLSCDACKFLARAPIRSCGLHHTICSICFEEHLGQNDCPAKGCKKKLMFKTVDSELTEAIRAMKLPVPCKNRKNGCPKKGEEKEVKEHEVECEFRIVDGWVVAPALSFRGMTICMIPSLSFFRRWASWQGGRRTFDPNFLHRSQSCASQNEPQKPLSELTPLWLICSLPWPTATALAPSLTTLCHFTALVLFRRWSVNEMRMSKTNIWGQEVDMSFLHYFILYIL